MTGRSEAADRAVRGMEEEAMAGSHSYRTDRDPDTPQDAPPLPRTVEETGLTEGFVTDLVMKTLYRSGTQSGRDLSLRTCLPFAILDEPLLALQQRRFVEVLGTEGHGRRSYRFDLTSEGKTRARDVLDQNAYVGPAPVPRDVYREWVERQSVRTHPISEERLRRGLEHLVLSDRFVDRLGAGINSGKSVFLYGDAGNGKTEVAFSVARIMGSAVYVPHAVELEGQIIQVYDPYVHPPLSDDEDSGDPLAPTDAPALWTPAPVHDPRFVRVRRPAVIVGGELTLDDLELSPGVHEGVFSAPPQMKANGGVFVLDDFGRQRVRPRDLLNRWMIPLDRATDYLTLPTGHKLEVPFDSLVFFATNLNPADLVEEAFLRRIRHKIRMPNPDREQFSEILRRVCGGRGISYSEEAVELVFREYYDALEIEPRACHPRDLVADICDHARYQGIEPTLSGTLLRDACRSYFIDLPRTGGAP